VSNLSISPSKLENFRKYYDEEFNGYVTAEKVIESIKGETVWSESMSKGSAYHEMIEYGPDPYKLENGIYRVVPEVGDPLIFNQQEVDPIYQYREEHPGLTFEIPHSYSVSVAGHSITMNMRIDAFWGNEVHDQKTTSKPPALANYEKSLQWMI
jgi:hypothetical protein